jgi:hypothetical protein
VPPPRGVKARLCAGTYGGAVDPLDGLRFARTRLNGSLETLAHDIAERLIDLLLHAVDLNAVLREIDVNALIDRVDVNGVLDRVDVNRLLDHVDVDRLLDHVDIGRVLERVDVGRLVDRVDVNAVVSRVDMDSLVQETDLGAVIAMSSGSLANNVVDVVRSQAVGLDKFTARWVGKVWRHRHPSPPGPPKLLQERAQS